MPPIDQPLPSAPLPPSVPLPPAEPAGPKNQIVERLRSATTVLVTVSANPTVDQLAACIGMTLMLNRAGKHATAVFSGKVPSTLEFLKPQDTIEQNTDSLQDFIISLDKSKADKLRYKVEDDVVKIFITPYHTSLSKDDLEFSLGDFNVEVVMALGVLKREDLDQVVLAHGRILHDATVIGLSKGEQVSGLGSINWQDTNASSLCEMAVVLGGMLGPDLIDNQIATALLTGVVAETERFSNAKTTPQVMSISAQLMASGANQQLIANKLEHQVETSLKVPKPKAGASAEAQNEAAEKKPEDGVLSIEHDENEIDISEAGRLRHLREEEERARLAALEAQGAPTILPEPAEPPIEPLETAGQLEEPEPEEPKENDQPEPEAPEPSESPEPPEPAPAVENPAPAEEPEPGPPTEPPKPEELPKQETPEPPAEAEIKGHSLLSGQGPDVGLTANTVPEHEQPDPSTDPMTHGRPRQPILSHKRKRRHRTIEPPKAEDKLEEALDAEEGNKLPEGAKKLTEPAPSPDAIPEDNIADLIGSTVPPAVDDARTAVEHAAASQPDANQAPIAALNAQPMTGPLNSPPATPPVDNSSQPTTDDSTKTDDSASQTPTVLDPTAPPPVPPPMMPQFFDQAGQTDNPYLNPDGTKRT